MIKAENKKLKLPSRSKISHTLMGTYIESGLYVLNSVFKNFYSCIILWKFYLIGISFENGNYLVDYIQRITQFDYINLFCDTVVIFF